MAEPSGPPGPADTGAGAREELARAQRELLAALVAGGPRPGGFDPERLRIQAVSLMAKRRGLVARADPDLVLRLGAEYGRLFAAYAEGRPKPPGGSRADARDFAGWLVREGVIDPPEADEGKSAGRFVSRVLRRLSSSREG